MTEHRVSTEFDHTLTEAEWGAIADVAVTPEAYFNGDHSALYAAVEGILAARAAAVERVLGPASTIVIGDDAPEARYWQQGADSVVRAVRAALVLPPGITDRPTDPTTPPKEPA